MRFESKFGLLTVLTLLLPLAQIATAGADDEVQAAIGSGDAGGLFGVGGRLELGKTGESRVSGNLLIGPSDLRARVDGDSRLVSVWEPDFNQLQRDKAKSPDPDGLLVWQLDAGWQPLHGKGVLNWFGTRSLNGTTATVSSNAYLQGSVGDLAGLTAFTATLRAGPALSVAHGDNGTGTGVGVQIGLDLEGQIGCGNGFRCDVRLARELTAEKNWGGLSNAGDSQELDLRLTGLGKRSLAGHPVDAWYAGVNLREDKGEVDGALPSRTGSDKTGVVYAGVGF